MRWRVPRIRRQGGRSRQGYGLPSLVVILFFASIMIQAIVTGIQRDTTEGRAEAAFNIARENLDTFKITGTPPDPATQPHVAREFMDLDVDYLAGSGGAPPLISFSFEGFDPRAETLFDEKLHAFLNIEGSNAIGKIRPEDIRREYPDRVLRRGDRMTTDLTTTNIDNARGLATGTADADTVESLRLMGVETTLLEAPEMTVGSLTTAKTNVSGPIQASDFIATQSLVMDILETRSAVVSGPLRAMSGSIPDTDVDREIASGNGIESYEDIDFDRLRVTGMRGNEIYAGAFTSPNIYGYPERGEFDGGTPQAGGGGHGGTSDVTECMAAGNSFYECTFQDDGSEGDDGSEDGEDGEEDDGEGDSRSPYEICRSIGMSDVLCSFYAGPFQKGSTMFYDDCIDQGGTPLFCEAISGGQGTALGEDGYPLTPYEQCLFEGGNEEICEIFDDSFPPAPEQPVTTVTYEECRDGGGSFAFCQLFPTINDECVGSVQCGTDVPDRGTCYEAGGNEQLCMAFPPSYDGPTYEECMADGGEANGAQLYCETFPDENGTCYPGTDCVTDQSDRTYDTCVMNGASNAFCNQFPLEEPFDGIGTQDQCLDAGGAQYYCENFPDETGKCAGEYRCDYDNSEKFYETCLNRGIDLEFCWNFPIQSNADWVEWGVPARELLSGTSDNGVTVEACKAAMDDYWPQLNRVGIAAHCEYFLGD